MIQPIKEASRKNGLAQVLEELQAKVGSWSMWESYTYRGTIVRSAGCLIAEELQRLTKKSYNCEMELQQNLPRTGQDQAAVDECPMLQQLRPAAAELKNTLRDEVPCSSEKCLPC